MSDEEPTVRAFVAPPSDEYELLKPVLDSGVSPIVDALSRSGLSLDEIIETVQRDHGVLLNIVSVERYIHHVQVVRASAPRDATNAYLDAAIRERHEDLQREAPEDLRRLDSAIDLLDRVVRADSSVVPSAVYGEDHRGRTVLVSGISEVDVLKARVKAATSIPIAIATKYRLTEKKITGEQEKGAQETLDAALLAVYGPTAKKQLAP